jgi:hypothetical protein
MCGTQYAICDISPPFLQSSPDSHNMPHNASPPVDMVKGMNSGKGADVIVLAVGLQAAVEGEGCDRSLV